jgi:hypothetical protein
MTALSDGLADRSAGRPAELLADRTSYYSNLLRHQLVESSPLQANTITKA